MLVCFRMAAYAKALKVTRAVVCFYAIFMVYMDVLPVKRVVNLYTASLATVFFQFAVSLAYALPVLRIAENVYFYVLVCAVFVSRVNCRFEDFNKV